MTLQRRQFLIRAGVLSFGLRATDILAASASPTERRAAQATAQAAAIRHRRTRLRFGMTTSETRDGRDRP